MKNYYRIMLGQKSIYAKEAYNGNYIGAGWLPDINLSEKLPENWRDFNKKFIPIYLEKNPDKKKVSAGLACGMLYTICKGIIAGDIVLCPDGIGNYYVGEVTGEYEYVSGSLLPHRRTVRWFTRSISREEMSESLRNSAGSIGTVSNISKYANEIEGFISGSRPASIISTDDTIEDPSIFALEKHLEDFLVQNWQHTELGKYYDIYEEDGEKVGQQYPSDTGPIDILAISKDKKELLIVELKKGRASDIVVGQIQRYMGYVQDELAEADQKVKGVIIAFEDDVRIHRALSVAQNIDFYTYKISFKLEKKK
ncbi:MAG: endonuclease NucS [Patescibacteria group bacterium]|jgi:restriction system protein|nr:endonuclease NucS [Patescibacteria group bacterium]